MRPKLVVISFSSLTAINRKVYSALRDRFDLQLIIPASARLGTSVKIAEPVEGDDTDLILLEITGENPRTQRFRGLWKTLRQHRPAYIFLENDPISILCVICCVYKIFNGTKILSQTNENLSLSLRNLFSRGSLKAKGLLFVKRLTNLFTRPLVDQVFAINYEGKEIYEKLGYRRVSWIPLGYSTEIFYQDQSARERIRKQLQLNGTAIGYFGRIVPQKGLLLLLNSLKTLTQYDWQLMIDDFSAYKTPYIEEIKLFIDQNGLAGRVVFFHATHEEIARYMNACDLVVVPSITEGSFKEQYGRVVQEAIACGCLTITSDSGFLPHFFQDDAFIFKENNVEAISNKILYFMEMDPRQKKEMLQKAMEYTDQFFTTRAQANVISRAITQLN